MTNNHLFSNLPFGSVGFHITSALPLQTLKGIGLHHITSHDYNWDNNTRKNSYLLLQYTLSGKGIFHISGVESFASIQKNPFLTNWKLS